ncbi:alpha-amlyase, partial [Butyricicoccus sp. 1XD8-22]
STLLLPGLPVMQYGTEIAMNGAVGPESHQLYNFRTDEELVDFIENIQMLKNSSDTLRGGEFKLLKNENGLLAFMRSSEDEKWIVVINNTSKTKRIDIPKDLVGEGKEIQAMLDSEVVRVNNENVYPLALDREVVEIYQVIDERGINIPYLIALGFVYLIFISFIVALMR